ncbi:unnamed protein product [Blepharisma stoltei]|uniref:O-methyltransferase C-terminal domain-containing protein n=1 Tax=Blepharisma stoltei TaxID=1481888 RepID=A0AAU9JE08_9CILI|nr:unnamed protein product [Blepharisma stoltei]
MHQVSDVIQKQVEKLFGKPTEVVDKEIEKMLLLPQLGSLLYIVVDLKIPQLLETGPKTAEELGLATSTRSDKLERVLLTLETKKLFNYNPVTKQFALNSISVHFLKEAYLDYIKFYLAPWQMDFLSVIPKSLKSDKTAPEEYYNTNFIDFLGQKPIYLEQFVNGITSHILWTVNEIGLGINLSDSTKVLEISGQGGALLIELARLYQHIQGTVYDIDLFKDITEKKIQENNFQEKLKFVSGNYLESIPIGYDTIVAKCISKENNDANFEKILVNMRNALNVGAKIFLVDIAIDKTHTNYRFERFNDIVAMSLTDGRVRTRVEIEAFLNRTGFRILNITPAKTDIVIEAAAV